MTLNQLKSFKKSGEKITCLTAYDASFAKIFDESDVDIILVGDSLGNVIKGDENTLGVCMDEMIYHTRAVASGVNKALLVADMPYQSYATAKQALKNAQTLINAGAQMVKLEGGRAHQACFQILQANHIPVCGHLGLQPQSILEMGGYKVQGRDKTSADKITEDAIALQTWGVQAIVLECIPADLAQKISNILNIPTIGIGAGVNCDGQVLVSYDMLGINCGKMPRFVENFLQNTDIKGAVQAFIKAVKNQDFPTEKHSYF